MFIFLTIILLFALVMLTAFHEKNNNLPNYISVKKY